LSLHLKKFAEWVRRGGDWCYACLLFEKKKGGFCVPRGLSGRKGGEGRSFYTVGPRAKGKKKKRRRGLLLSLGSRYNVGHEEKRGLLSTLSSQVSEKKKNNGSQPGFRRLVGKKLDTEHNKIVSEKRRESPALDGGCMRIGRRRGKRRNTC